MPNETFILISGAWHGSWCWHKIVSRLERAGHLVVTPDLPAYGTEHVPHREVTLECWTRNLCDVLAAQSQPAILVGHSRSGILLSQVAERLPEKIKTLIYVSGFLLRKGESILRSLRNEGTSGLLQHVNLTADRSSWIVAESAIKDLFYSQCSESDIEFARSRLSLEPAEPLMKPVQVTERNFGRVPRVYIECLRDKALPLRLQRQMQQAWPCQVLTLDTDHSPFFSEPDALAAQLLACAAHPVHSKR